MGKPLNYTTKIAARLAALRASIPGWAEWNAARPVDEED